MFDESATFLSAIQSWWQRVQIVSTLKKLVQLPVWMVLLASFGGVGGLGICAVGLLQAVSSRVHAEQNPTVLHTTQIREAVPAASVTLDPSGPEGTIVVEVSGAVTSPGVFTLGTDARLIDALTAAQGLTPEADAYYVARALNQSARLIDGQKIFVPSPDDHSIELACADVLNGGGHETTKISSGDSEVGLVSINEATQAELEALPGIGSKRASDIIAGRPYTETDQLLATDVVTEKIYMDIESLIKL